MFVKHIKIQSAKFTIEIIPNQDIHHPMPHQATIFLTLAAQKIPIHIVRNQNLITLAQQCDQLCESYVQQGELIHSLAYLLNNGYKMISVHKSPEKNPL